MSVLLETVDHLSCASCRKCGSMQLKTRSAMALIHGVETVLHNKECTLCGATFETAEMPIEVARDVWAE